MPLPARLLFSCFALFALADDTRAAAQDWLLTVDRWGTPDHRLLHWNDEHGRLSGSLGGDTLDGRRKGSVVHFSIDTNDGASYVFDGRLSGALLTGQADFPDPNQPQRRVAHAFTARPLPQRPPGPARTYTYKADSYANAFSAERAPVLTLWPGDSLVTETVDSGGVDRHGNTVALFGNPQVGPFFIAGAMPGDTLAVHLTRLRLNRDHADSLDGIVHRALSSGQAAAAATLGKPVRWKLDRTRGTATPDAAEGKLAALAVPVRPMLGGLALAPGFGSPPMSTGDTGRSGGNMDFNAVVEGNTVYLPVMQPGALLYFGDGHALQGDGETSQYALETSLDVELRIELLRGQRIEQPRVESPTQLLVLGQAGSLDEALRPATAGLSQWLQRDYGLSLSETAQLLGCCVQYRVANLAGRSVGLAAAIDKRLLQDIPRATP